MIKKHGVYRTGFSNEIGSLCRLIVFAEDVVEDAECEDLRVKHVNSDSFILKPIDCNHDVNESILVFKKQYEPLEVILGEASLSYRALYDQVIAKYVESIHPYMKKLFRETFESGVEFLAGVTFDGRFFVLEGGKGSIKIPAIPHCLSIHTHPSLHPIPSIADLKSIMRLLVDRGVGHVIIAGLSSMAIYRVKPLIVEEYEDLKKKLLQDPLDALEFIKFRSEFLKLKYLS